MDELKASEKKGDTRVKTNLGYGPYSAASDKHEITWCNKLVGNLEKSPVVQDNDLIYYRYGYVVMLDAELKYYKKGQTRLSDFHFHFSLSLAKQE